ncbi:MAG TPA: deoxyribodipyrimidine photolyase [Myxococcota bacterium]
MTVPAARVRIANEAPTRPSRDYVLYWMVGARRANMNFALDRALSIAGSLGKPVLVFEPLRAGHRWASDRIHGFVVDGMRDNERAFAAAGVTYFPYLEPEPGADKGLLAALAHHACAVVTDDALGFFQPRMIASAAAALDVTLEVVDGNGLMPIRVVDKAYPSAAHFRRLQQRELPKHLLELPRRDPLRAVHGAPAVVPSTVRGRWPAADLASAAPWSALAIDHGVAPSSSSTLRGGSSAARAALRAFLEHKLERYGADRSQPDLATHSGLSPWLHFGHIGAHEVFAAVARREQWSPDRCGHVVTGNKAGFFGMSENAEAFLDELVTWRELAHNGAAFLHGFETYDANPAWSRASLQRHAHDEREHSYSLAALEAADTHDALWNAAQRQLVHEGVIHNYLRMLWGKKVLEWSASPEQAFAHLVQLNNKYALDGRDPNSYAGISWCFGRYDRPWPERAIFGVVRCMTSASTMKKLALTHYLSTWRTPA